MCTVASYIVSNKGKFKGDLASLPCKLVWDSKVLSIYGGKKFMEGLQVTFQVNGGLTEVGREWDNVEKIFPIGKTIKIEFDGVTGYGIPKSPRIVK